MNRADPVVMNLHGLDGDALETEQT